MLTMLYAMIVNNIVDYNVHCVKFKSGKILILSLTISSYRSFDRFDWQDPLNVYIRWSVTFQFWIITEFNSIQDIRGKIYMALKKNMNRFKLKEKNIEYSL